MIKQINVFYYKIDDRYTDGRHRFVMAHYYTPCNIEDIKKDLQSNKNFVRIAKIEYIKQNYWR